MKSGNREVIEVASTWIDGGFDRQVKELRKASPGLTVIRREDRDRVLEGAIYLPWQYMQTPSISVLADTQSAITLTFLQHRLTRKLAKTSKTVQIDAEGDSSKLINAEFKECEYYKHQVGWEALVDNSGSLRSKPIEVVGPINPARSYGMSHSTRRPRSRIPLNACFHCTLQSLERWHCLSTVALESLLFPKSMT